MTVAAVRDPATPAKEPVIEISFDNPRTNQNVKTPTGINRLKNMTTAKNVKTKYVLFFESSNLLSSLGVPDTFADLLISLPL